MPTLTEDNFFLSAIKSGYQHATNVRTPDVTTSDRPIFLADTKKRGTIVCKFVDYNIAFRDRQMSRLLADKKIPAPDMTIHGYLDQWYEAYKYNPCQTLAQHIKNLPGDDKILNLYKQILDVQATLSESSLDEFRVNRCKYFSDVFKNTTPRAWPKIISAIYNMGIKAASRFGDERLVHCDLKPHNILCNDDVSLNQIIDISAIAIATDEFAMILLLDGFPLPDMSDELMDYYDKITHRKLNRKFIKTGLAIVKRGKQIHNAMRRAKTVFNDKAR